MRPPGFVEPQVSDTDDSGGWKTAVQNTKGSSLQSEGTIFCYIILENETNVLSFIQYTHSKSIFFLENVNII